MRTLVSKPQPSQDQGKIASRAAPSRRGERKQPSRLRTGRVLPGATLYANSRPSDEAAVLSGYMDPDTGLAVEDAPETVWQRKRHSPIAA